MNKIKKRVNIDQFLNSKYARKHRILSIFLSLFGFFYATIRYEYNTLLMYIKDDRQ